MRLILKLVTILFVGLLTTTVIAVVPQTAEAAVEDQITEAEIQEIADGRRLSFAEVEVASNIAASVNEERDDIDGHCPSAVWLTGGASKTDHSVLLMRIYNGDNSASGWKSNAYPACFNPGSLTEAIVDSALQFSETADGTYDLDSYNVDNISNKALVDAMFAYNSLVVYDGQERASMSPERLDVAMDAVTKDIGGFLSSDYAETQEIFGDWVSSTNAEDIRFTKDAVLAMYDVGYFTRSSAAGQSYLPFSTASHVTHYSSFWSSLWANVKYISQADLNIYIGFLEALENESGIRVSDYFSGADQEWSAEREEGIGEIVSSMFEKEVVGLPAIQNMLNAIADTMVFDPDITDIGRTYAEERRVAATEEGDPLSVLFLIKASSKHSDDLVEYVEAAANNTHLLENATASEEFADLGVTALQELMTEAWGDLYGSPDPSVSTTTNPVGTTADDAGTTLGDDKLAQSLSEKDGTHRFDYALEGVASVSNLTNSLGEALGFGAEYMDNWQLRIFFTHPRKEADNGRYRSEFRIRLFDEVGVTGSTKIPGGEASASAGMQNYHDFIVPILMDADMGNASVGALQWRNSYNFIIEGDANATNALQTLSTVGSNVAATVGSPPPAPAPTVSAYSSAASIGRSTLSSLASVVQNGDIEIGVGYGVYFNYDLANMRDEAPWTLVVAPLLWTVGAAAGAYLTGAFVAPYIGGVLGPHAAFAATHFGTDIGAVLGNIAAVGIIDGFGGDDLVAVSHGSFFWGAVRPIKVNIVSDVIYARTRFQYNIDFSEVEVP